MIRAPEQVALDEQRLRRAIPTAGLLMLVVSAICLGLAPLLMPNSYSIVEHSISESAAQRVEGVWLARAGLTLFGLAVFVLASAVGSRWGLWGRVAHRTYGVAMIGTAVFAHMPWEDVAYDEFEDFLHSVASFAVGLTFVVGVILVSMERPHGLRGRALDAVAVVASIVIPMIMFNTTGYAGMVQRVMFAIAYLWFATEAWRALRPGMPPVAWEDSPISAD